MDNLLKKQLVEKALAAREHAYAPYSRYRVGAAVLTGTGKIFTGSNIENASYGLTNCAERTAIFKAVSEGERDFVALAVAVDTATPAAPCGACRQVMQEFFSEQTTILLVNNQGDGVATQLSKLLPDAFSKEHM